ncbi:MAG: FapA family protein [Treponema sp.]|jgi:uncharacterized protein (DUF342 family)|nr:FapA family protein [Treponema sp.]
MAISADEQSGREGPPQAVSPYPSSVIPRDKNDGHIAVTIAGDAMAAWGDFFPPVGAGEPVSDGYINSLLVAYTIVHGVRWEAIQDAAMYCRLERKILRGTLIARGDEPVTEETEYFAINPHLKNAVLIERPNARIDYRSQSPFIIVKQGQILAQLRPKKNGRPGKNIRGAEIPCKVIRVEGVSGGKNTRTDEKYIYSQINGQLVEADKVLQVNDSLVIPGAVGYATGNIIFPGDVTIEGPVSDGFTIYSGGSVAIKQTFDVTSANIKGDLAVSGGIIGRGRALVKAGGALKTKFIDNCRIACRKAVTVDMEILNSSVYTMETLEMGDKGNILGSDIYAVHGIKAGNIGKKSAKRTRIHCGVDFTVQREMEKRNNHLGLLSAKLAKLRELLAEPLIPEKRANLEALFHRLEEERDKTARLLSDLMPKTNRDENALVLASGEIAPGTLIEICQRALFVSEPLRRVRIKLDRTAGRLVHEPLPGSAD